MAILEGVAIRMKVDSRILQSEQHFPMLGFYKATISTLLITAAFASTLLALF
jgi:hypothetical protein